MSLIGLMSLGLCMDGMIHAQTYTTAAGIRLGNSIGFSVNQRVTKKWTVEGIVQNDFKETTNFHLLARRHHSLLTRRANWYYGAGAHIGSDTEVGTLAGFDGVLGIEMTLLRFNVSLDVKPSWSSGENNGMRLNGAASVRYVILQDKVFRDWDRKRKQRARRKKRNRWKGKMKERKPSRAGNA